MCGEKENGVRKRLMLSERGREGERERMKGVGGCGSEKRWGGGWGVGMGARAARCITL